MKIRVIFILLIISTLFSQGLLWAQDIKPSGPKQQGRFTIAASDENTVLLDTQTGETWMLVKSPNLSQPYEWKKIPSPVEQKTEAQDWVSITQGQKKGDIVTGKADIIKWRENELAVTKQNTAKLQSNIAQLESARQKINSEIMQNMLDAAKADMTSAMDEWKAALDLLKDIQEQQSQSINNLGRL